MLLASNKQHKEITKGRKTQRDRQNAQRRTAGKKKDQEVLQETPHFQDYKILYRTIWKAPNAEIPKMNFLLFSNPLVLLNRIFRAWLSFFREQY
jgi:hypothetical protein